MVIVSGGQQRVSAIHMHVSILPQTPLPSRLLPHIGQSPLCCTAGPCHLSILNMAVFTCPSLRCLLTIIFPINPLKNLYCRHLGDSYMLYAPQTCGERTSGHSVSTRWIVSSCVHTHGYLGPTSLLAISPAWLRSEPGGKIYYMDILFQPGTWPLGEEVWLLKQQTVNQPRGRSNIT